MPVDLSRPRTAQVVGSVAAAALLLATALVPASAAAPAPSCSDLATPVLQRVRPANGANLLTTWPTEAVGAARNGFTTDAGTAFRASRTGGSGLVAVRRLYSARSGDFLFSTDPGEIQRVKAAGYRDQGVRFYVSARPAPCLVGVERFVKGAVHRLAVAGQGAGLLAGGWRKEGVTFYARPAGSAQPAAKTLTTKPIPTTSGTRFSFAAVPDTQQEVLRAGDPRMAHRSSWVLKQPKMSFLLQTGDLVNWDTDDHAQWANAKRGLAPIERAKLPYTIAVGNHDSLAAGVGGSARDPRRSHLLVRDTRTMNAYFSTADFRGVGGTFEAGKVDNVYTLYQAGGLRWMVLTLEFCPRRSVVAWAKRVVAAHPRYNVIISTHFYLTASGKIGTNNQGYGETSPTYLWRELVSRYPNIAMVFSGHAGTARKARVDKGAKGRKVYSFLTTMHDRVSNPTRIVTVDTKARTITTRVSAPYTKKTWSQFSQTIKGVTFTR